MLDSPQDAPWSWVACYLSMAYTRRQRLKKSAHMHMMWQKPISSRGQVEQG
jgi:hypothetical protein